MTMDPQTLKDTSIAELLKRVQGDLISLVDTEKKLVKTEMSLKWDEAKEQGAALMVALTFSLLAGICLTASAVLALGTVLEPWLAALIVGAVLLVGCAVAFMKLKSAGEKFTLKPTHTIDNVKQDVNRIGEVAR